MAAHFPRWIEPMAATLTQERFSGPEWIFERKHDGIRLLVFKQGSDVRLLSRNQLPQDDAYPAVRDAVAHLPRQELILDGEAIGGWGRGARGHVSYQVFDIMWNDGDLTALPLEDRHRFLDELPFRLPLVRVNRLDGSRPWERARQEGWEGVIAKRLGSTYQSRRSRHWLKMKCESTQELVVGGFTEPKGRRQGLGALLMGYFETGDLVFAGKVGTGFDTALLLQLRATLDKLEIPSPPFTRAVALPRAGAHWVRPELVVQVAFIEWTRHGKLRHPRFLGIRTDKSAGEVLREGE